jgi:hypothetical protein
MKDLKPNWTVMTKQTKRKILMKKTTNETAASGEKRRKI